MIDMRATMVLDYTQGIAKVICKDDKFSSWCDKCKEIDDFGDIEAAYVHAMNHHNENHRL